MQDVLVERTRQLFINTCKFACQNLKCAYTERKSLKLLLIFPFKEKSCIHLIYSLESSVRFKVLQNDVHEYASKSPFTIEFPTSTLDKKEANLAKVRLNVFREV